jgi:signal transduction histidine kinase
MNSPRQDPEEIRRLGLLARQIAHDMNNSLSSVLGYASLLKGKLDKEDPRHRYSAMIEEAGNQIGDSVSRLLMFGRIWTTPPSLVPVGLDAAQQETAHVLEGGHGTPRAEVESEFAEGKGKLNLDLRGLQSAYEALGQNACEAQPEADPPRIRVRFSLVDQDALPEPPAAQARAGKWLQVQVTDPGKGMDAETLARALEAGFTTHGGARRQGLGLPTVLGFAHVHAGAMAIESAEGEGTTVTLWLPMDELA